MTIEIVDFPINHGDFPVRYVKLPEGTLLSFHSLELTIHVKDFLQGEAVEL